MMKAKISLILALAILSLTGWWGLVAAWSEGTSRTSVGFIIIGAEGTNYFSTAGSSELQALISQVPPRFVLQFAEGLRYHAMEPAPESLLNLINQVGPRFVLQYAGGNRFYSTAYPIELIGDTSPPEASNLQAIINSADQVTIRWNTNEYATTFLEYGTQPGVYTEQFSNDLYTLNHQVVLSNLAAGQTYYYRFGGTDRSGNSFMSSQHQFSTQLFLYLPVVVRGQ